MYKAKAIKSYDFDKFESKINDAIQNAQEIVDVDYSVVKDVSNEIYYYTALIIFKTMG